MEHEATDRIIDTTRERLTTSGRSAVAYTGHARAAEGEPFARFFDHTLLKQTATAEEYLALCAEAAEIVTRSVCVPPDRVRLCAGELAGTAVEVCTVIGFPFGYHSTAAKVTEVQIARSLGAVEFDMVIPVGRLRDGQIEELYDDIRPVVVAADGALVKVILETSELSDQQKVEAGTVAIHAGAAILKTSTGFASAGATIADIELLRRVAGSERGVKASGGIRDRAFAEQCIAAGADRIGASATMSIVAAAAPDSNGGGY